MKTPEQLKGAIRSMATKKNLRAQEVLQMYLFERVLERLARSTYQNNFILKGGLLISSLIGIGERTTMDMDTTVRGIQMEENEIVTAVKEILTVDVGDGITFEYQSIEPIREDDAYNNFRVHLRAKYGKIDSPMKIDITTGDVITPAAIQYDFPMLFEEKTVSVMAYTLETVLAEKYETIIRRNIGTIADMVNLAPLLKPSILARLSQKFQEQGIDISYIVVLAEYLNDETVMQLIENATFDEISDELLEKFIPMLNHQSKEVIFQKILDGEMDWHFIKVLLPYAGYITTHIEAAVVEGVLPQEVLGILNDYRWDWDKAEYRKKKVTN